MRLVRGAFFAPVQPAICAGLLFTIAAVQVGRGRVGPPVPPANAAVREVPPPAGMVEQLRVGMLRPGGGYTVSTLPLETYVARVVAGEAARDSPPAALEALAITVRTFALANAGRHRADGFDVCDQTHCQVVRTATPATTDAARATAGRVLVNGAAIASVFYSASCGGRTEIPSAVWPGADDPSYLPSHIDDACGGEPSWSAELRSSDLLRALRAAGFRGAALRDVRVAVRNASGRVARLRVAGLRPDQISGQELRVAVGRTLGWQYIKSTAFQMERKGDAYRFSGHGSGHGVGLCVIGSARLAVGGQTATEILARYFPGLGVSGDSVSANVSSGEVVVALPAGDEDEQAQVVKEAIALRDDMVRTLGVPKPPRIVLRFHATTDDYEHATGRPWFTSAATMDGELHLLPVMILRERGMLERAVRHELVHLLTDSVLAGRKLWVREGAATYFADQTAAAAGPPRLEPQSLSCPTNQELQFPASVGALSNAYARARACFARQIQSGRNWRDVQ